MLIDSHVHVATADTDAYPLRPTGVGSDWWRDGADVDSLLHAMDAGGVDAAVLVQAVGAYGFDCSYVLDAAATAPTRLVVVDAVDADAPEPQLRADVAGTRLFGVASPEPPTWLTDGRAVDLWQQAAAAGTTLIPTLWARDLPALRPLVEGNPAVAVALDHCGFPDLTGGPPYAEAATLLDLVDLPAVHLKVSTHLLAHLPDPAALVDVLAERFGPERLVWGSDFPQTEGLGYGAMVALGRRACRNLDDAAADGFLGGNAHRLWFGDRSTTSP